MKRSICIWVVLLSVMGLMLTSCNLLKKKSDDQPAIVNEEAKPNDKAKPAANADSDTKPEVKALAAPQANSNSDAAGINVFYNDSARVKSETAHRDQAMGKVGAEAKKLLDVVVKDMKTDLKTIEEDDDSQSLDVLLDNCSKFPEHCHIFFGISLDKAIIDFKNNADILVHNLVENDDDHEDTSFIFYYEALDMSGVEYLKYKNNPSMYPLVQDASQKLTPVFDSAKWGMSKDEFDWKLFYIYALNKEELELYADGILMIAEAAEETDLSGVREYWSNTEEKLIYIEYADLTKRLEAIGLEFRNLAGRVQKISADK